MDSDGNTTTDELTSGTSVFWWHSAITSLSTNIHTVLMFDRFQVCLLCGDHEVLLLKHCHLSGKYILWSDACKRGNFIFVRIQEILNGTCDCNETKPDFLMKNNRYHDYTLHI